MDNLNSIERPADLMRGSLIGIPCEYDDNKDPIDDRTFMIWGHRDVMSRELDGVQRKFYEGKTHEDFYRWCVDGEEVYNVVTDDKGHPIEYTNELGLTFTEGDEDFDEPSWEGRGPRLDDGQPSNYWTKVYLHDTDMKRAVLWVEWDQYAEWREPHARSMWLWTQGGEIEWLDIAHDEITISQPG